MNYFWPVIDIAEIKQVDNTQLHNISLFVKNVQHVVDN